MDIGSSTGTTVDNSSKENQQLHQDLSSNAGGSTTINQTNINSSQPQQQSRKTERVDDKSAYERKSRLK